MDVLVAAEYHHTTNHQEYPDLIRCLENIPAWLVSLVNTSGFDERSNLHPILQAFPEVGHEKTPHEIDQI